MYICCRERQAMRYVPTEDRDVRNRNVRVRRVVMHRVTLSSSREDWRMWQGGEIERKEVRKREKDREREKKRIRQRGAGAGGKERLAQQYGGGGEEISVRCTCARGGGACHRRGVTRIGKSNVNLEKRTKMVKTTVTGDGGGEVVGWLSKGAGETLL